MRGRDRLLLLITGLLAAYQVAVGIEGLGNLAIASYTLAFGVLLVAALLLIILGYEALSSPWVVIVSTLLPLGISAGLVAEHCLTLASGYGAFAIAGAIAVALTRFLLRGRSATVILAVVHGIAGLIITGLPVWAVVGRGVSPTYLLVSLGGALIGMAGLLLTFLRIGRPVMRSDQLQSALPLVLALSAGCFIAGMGWGT